jgi:carbonic anhydrase/acetyltransferase-like protein (isoleucine patch superfamily)
MVLFIQDTGNKVSRKAIIAGPQNIILGGKTIISNGAIIRGDLRRTGSGHTVVISLGRYCLIGEGCVMRYVYFLFSACECGSAPAVTREGMDTLLRVN